MKKQLMLILVISFTLLALPKTNFSQTLNLGILSTFEGYTGAGGVAAGDGTTWKGDAGTNAGIISGLGTPPSFTGKTYNDNAITLQCRFDLFRVYIHLNDLFVNFPATHAAAFGGGEMLAPGVYSIPGAGSLGTTITLDGGGNPNAFFVIKFYGAMTVGAGAEVKLTGGTQSCNVFWIAEGAISVAASAKMKGTLFAKIGAVGLGAGAELEGRMLTLEGALTTGVGAKVSPPPGISTIPIFCESGCSPAAAVDVLGVVSNFALYTNLGAVSNTSTSGIDGNIGAASGGFSGYESSIVVGEYHVADALSAQANIDIDKAYNALMALPNTVLNHTAAFGLGETIKAGVYSIAGAGSLGGTITLDAENNKNAIFVFKFSGAFGVGAQSKIILANGARRCNVFWIGGAGAATGAISIGAGSALKGTFLSHGGACTSGDGTFLSGRLLSTGGAVTTYSGIIYNNPVCVTSNPIGNVIKAIADTTAAINGLNGGTTTSLTSNDLLKGAPVVIGSAVGNVTLTGVTVPTGLTLNADGTVTIAPNTAAGNYSLTYQICEVTNPTSTNCSSVTSIIVVSAPPPAGDLTLTTVVAPIIMHGTTQFKVTVRLTELLGLPTNGSEIMVRIPKDSRITFTFNTAATTIGFSPVNNSVWTYDGTDPTFHIFKTSSVIAASTFSTFGFDATFKPGGSSGSYTFSAAIKSGSGGDKNSQNNEAANIVDYFIN